MTAVTRTDASILGQWWAGIDRWLLGALLLLLAIGALMVFAASPTAAERIAQDGLHFVKRQLIVMPAALGALLLVSLLAPRQIRRLAVIGYAASLLLMALTLVQGAEIKGAQRWLSVAGLSLQPSEFAKPMLAVVSAWLFARWQDGGGRKFLAAAVGALLLVVCLLVSQPDFGMTAVVVAVWLIQFFLAGMPLRLLGVTAPLLFAGLVAAYELLPHVARRIDLFLHPHTGDTYQIDRSLQAFANGGLLGTGPGEGTIKTLLPDAHGDFVFAVLGEEFGAVAGAGVVILFAFIVLRGLGRPAVGRDSFAALAVAGLLSQLGLQALIHMTSALRLIPAKGMTLPFISYGGSSLLAMALGMGMMLGLSRRMPRGGA